MGNDAVQRLRDRYMLLLADDEYQREYDRLGIPAIVDRLDDASVDSKKRMKPVEWLEHYRNPVKAGLVPDPVVLNHVETCFAKYLEGKGDITLDEAFGLRGVQKAGNPARQYARSEQINLFCYEMARYRTANNQNASLAEAAEYVANLLGVFEPDCDTWVRYYTRGNWDKLLLNQD